MLHQLSKQSSIKYKKKYGQDTTPDLFLLQNDKNHKLFDKYTCQKEKDVLQYKQVKRKGERNA